jgi:outer membrane protein OmpA-like peptidoglycan-associated protein
MRRVDLDDINFEFGAWEITNDQMPKLERLARVINSILRSRPDEVFLIEGHTDAVGSEEDNLTLSDRRAEAVAVILSDQFEVPPENLTTQGYGEQFLKVDTGEAERLNRRVAARRITPLLAREEARRSRDR